MRTSTLTGPNQFQPVPAPDGDPTPDQMVTTGEAATIIGKTTRTAERWCQNGWLRHGRPTNPATGEPLFGSHRWVDVRHAVAYAVSSGRAHLIPAKWRHLAPATTVPAQPTGT